MSCKGVMRRDEMLDKFSEIPDNVMDMILNRIPLRDAVRTSILSTKWKHNWKRTGILRLDRNFFNEVFGAHLEHELILEIYVRTVTHILMSYGGLIREFYLYISGIIPAPDENIINMWILYVSRCGVQDLSLVYENEDFLYPSVVFKCLELKHLYLKIHDLIIGTKEFRKLSVLISLDLAGESVSGDVLTKIISNCPLLESFSLNYEFIDGSFGPVIIDAPKLKLLSVECSDIFYVILKNTPNITTFSLQQKSPLLPPEPEEIFYECPDILEVFEAIPKVENVILSGDALGEFVERNDPEKLPSPLESHTSLIIRDLNIYMPGELRSLFCLIESSPKLQKLEISMKYPPEIVLDSTSDYLQTKVEETEEFSCLRTVRLTNLMGGEPEIILIEVILSCCPILEKLYLNSNVHISSTAEYEMTTTAMQFRPASYKVEVICAKSN